MDKKNILIAGAGLGGLSVAWHLQRLGASYRLFEKEKEPGGLCRSRAHKGYVFDQGGHVLHFKDPRTLAFVRDLLGKDLKRHTRRALFFAFGKYGLYPFQAHLGGMPPDVIRECLDGAQEAHQKNGSRREYPKARHFRSWVLDRFGEGIARHFLIPYNMKFWRVPLEDLACAWAEEVIPVPSFAKIRAGARCQRTGRWGYNAVFWYPRKGGIEALPRAMAAPLKHMVTGCSFKRVDWKKKEVELASGEKERFDALVSTIPLPDLGRILKDVPGEIRACFDRLRWNSILNYHIGLEEKTRRRCHWIYFPQESMPFFRIGLPHCLSAAVAPSGKGSLSVEIAYQPGGRPEGGTLLKKTLDGLLCAGLIAAGNRVRVLGSADIAYGYPIYDHHCARSRQEILRFLNARGIFSVGRYGGWKYMSMEDVMLEGRSIAVRLAA